MDYTSFFIILIVYFGFAKCYYQNQGSYSFENHKYCDDLSPYFGDINLDQVSGVWYGVEKIHHYKGEYKIEHTQECFYIDIKEQYIEPTPPSPYGFGYNTDRSLTNYYGNNYANNYNNPAYGMTPTPYVSRAFGIPEQYRIRHFVLEWHEGIWQDDYHIKVNTSHKGFWPTDVPNGNVDQRYRFFGGVIQVLHTGINYLVLNFCMRLPNSQLFSVILSRNENQLTSEDLASIHNIFTMKHLSTSSLKRVCDRNGGTIVMPSLLLLSIWFLVWLRHLNQRT